MIKINYIMLWEGKEDHLCAMISRKELQEKIRIYVKGRLKWGKMREEIVSQDPGQR